jgi:hypothetical protein
MLRRILQSLSNHQTPKPEAPYSYEDYRASLPHEATFPTIGEDYYISTGAAACNEELCRIVGMTVENVNRYIENSNLPDSLIYSHINQRNYHPHASAFIAKNQRIVSINAGTFFAINDICSTLVHRHYFMPDLLETSDRHTICLSCKRVRSFCGWLTDYNWLASPTAETKPWNPMVSSLTPTPRAVIGGFLMLRSLYWWTAHEIGHLVLDHLTLIDRNYYDEHSASKTPEERLLYHILETEADLFATTIDAELRYAKENLSDRLERARAQTDYRGSWPEVTDEFTARLLMIVPAIVATVFAVNCPTTTSKHPEPSLRYWLSVDALLSSFRYRYGDKLNNTKGYLEDNLALSRLSSSWHNDPGETIAPPSKEECMSRNSDLLRDIENFQREHGRPEDRLLEKGLFERFRKTGEKANV